MLNLGVRLHDLGKASAEEMAKRACEYGFRSIQLALHKSIEGCEFRPGYLSPGFAKYMRDTFKNRGVQIAVLGCYINPIHPDPVVRKKHLDFFREHIAFAHDFGCTLVATETGSANPDCSFNPTTGDKEHFEDFVGEIAELVATAEQFGVFVGIEGVSPQHTINTYEKMRTLIEEIDSPNLRVLYDPVNFLPHDDTKNQEQHVSRAFELFKDRMAAIHLKDFTVENNMKKGGLPAGEGMFNFKHLFSLLKKEKPYIECLLENGTPETMQRISGHLNEIWDSA
ncbi:MAG: sugar phosphate isomerase/epimerase [Spirochaetales bacterium]|nr:sugar phosphate isomerase/epimerase [Spirochaetales bacterium]